MTVTGGSGSGGDDGCVENFKLWMSGMEKWILQAAEYQQSVE